MRLSVEFQRSLSDGRSPAEFFELQTLRPALPLLHPSRTRHYADYGYRPSSQKAMTALSMVGRHSDGRDRCHFQNPHVCP
jgi:hypothetical protein